MPEAPQPVNKGAFLTQKQPATAPTASRAKPVFDIAEDDDVFFPPKFAISTPTPSDHPVEHAAESYFDHSMMEDDMEEPLLVQELEQEAPRVPTAPAIPRGPTANLVPIKNLSMQICYAISSKSPNSINRCPVSASISIHVFQPHAIRMLPACSAQREIARDKRPNWLRQNSCAGNGHRPFDDAARPKRRQQNGENRLRFVVG